jgi:hypothetical protein
MTSDAILQTYYGPDVQVVRSTPGAASVAFTATPTGGTAGVALSVQPVVTILDATGQPVVTGPASTSVVSLELAPNAVGAVLQCDGGTTRAAVAGVATFAGCLVSAPGSGLLLTAQAAGLVPATAPLEIAPGAPTITLAAAPPTVTWGTSIAFTLTMAPPAGGAPVAGRAVHVERSADGVDWIPDRDVTTDASGNATWTERPATNGWYRATFAGSPDLGPATSGVPRVLVRQLAVLRPGNGGAVRAVARGTAVSFVATVRPNRPELAPARVQFDVYGLKGTVWTLSRTATVTVDSTGRATLRQVFASFGRWRVRAIALPTPANANSVWSPPEEYLVR